MALIQNSDNIITKITKSITINQTSADSILNSTLDLFSELESTKDNPRQLSLLNSALQTLQTTITNDSDQYSFQRNAIFSKSINLLETNINENSVPNEETITQTALLVSNLMNVVNSTTSATTIGNQTKQTIATRALNMVQIMFNSLITTNINLSLSTDLADLLLSIIGVSLSQFQDLGVTQSNITNETLSNGTITNTSFIRRRLQNSIAIQNTISDIFDLLESIPKQTFKNTIPGEKLLSTQSGAFLSIQARREFLSLNSEIICSDAKQRNIDLQFSKESLLTQNVTMIDCIFYEIDINVFSERESIHAIGVNVVNAADTDLSRRRLISNSLVYLKTVLG